MTESDTTLLLGGLIGFISAVLSPVISEPIRNMIHGPRLDLVFNPNNRDCKSRTQEIVTLENSNVVGGVTNATTEAYYIRARVENKGHQIAKQCKAYLISVEKYNPNTRRYEDTIYCESIPLTWSASGSDDDKFRAIDLPRGVKQYIDLISTRRILEGYRLEIKTHLLRYEELFRSQGEFLFTILISGDNVKPVYKKIMFEWNGTWDGFRLE